MKSTPNTQTVEIQLNREELFGRYDQLPEAKWIVEGIVMEGGISVMAGEYGVGKTTLAMQIIDTLNNHNGLFDLETNTTTALLIEQDESHYVMGNHIRRLLPVLPTLKDMEYPHKQLRWDTNTDRLNIDDLGTMIVAYPAGLVIIDSLTSIGVTLATSNELESKRAVEKIISKLSEKEILEVKNSFDKFGVDEL